MEEIWKPMPQEGFSENYEISNLGRVRSKERKTIKTYKNGLVQSCIINCKILKNRPNLYGYLRVSLCLKNLKIKEVMVHRMVAMAFIGYPTNPEYQVNHKNGIKHDNRLENLEWVTPSENIRHAFATKLIVVGTSINNKNSKKINQYDMQDNLVRKFDCINDVKVLCNMCPSLVIDVLKGRRKSAYKSKWQYA